MPLCFCVSHGCSSAGGIDPISRKPKGKNVDSRALKAHLVADRQAALHAAEQNTEAAIDTQIEEITVYLSASVLADEVSSPSQSPGSSLWSRYDNLEDHLPQDKADKHIATPQKTQLATLLPAAHKSHPGSRPGSRPTSLHSPPRQAGSRRSREDEILASLANIEVEVDALNHEASNNLARLGEPSPSGPPSSFPLADLFLLSNDLKSRLEIITFKGTAVLELKGSIFLKLQNIDHKLMIAKRAWNEKLANIRATKIPVYGLPFDTGKVLLS
jgi:hypothetical protein